MNKDERVEAISRELLSECAKKGLTIEEMYDLAMFFPRFIRREINALESSTVFTLSSAQDVQR